MMIQKIIFALVLFSSFAQGVYAIGDDFGIRFRVGDDTQAPTAPTALTAVPVAQTQIDLSWTASVDDLVVSGYQVFRDASQVATTSLTSYSDSGLSASTTYSYFVRAFDTSFNISSSSNVVATTTFSIAPTSTPTSTPPSNGGGNNFVVELVSFLLEPSQYGALIEWETSRYAQFELRWGRTDSYELGFVVNNLFQKEHTTSISDLRPGTVYEFQLTARDRDGKVFVLKEATFTTRDAPDTKAPANVLNLQAEVFGNNVHLTWDNPPDSDFSYVRILRNYLFYPTDIYDGYVVYQDNGSAFLDAGSLDTRNVQYYTVFSYDADGNISSGAVAMARKSHQPSQTEEQTPSATTTDAVFDGVNFDDLIFLQDTEVAAADAIDAEVPLVIRIAYDALPKHLKAITVTLNYPDSDEQVISVLLRVNNDTTFYEATVAPLETIGTYPVQLSVFDYQTELLQTVTGSIQTYKNKTPADFFDIPYAQKMSLLLSLIILCTWIVFCIGLISFVYNRMRDKKQMLYVHTTSKALQIVLACLLYGIFGIGTWLCAGILVYVNMIMTAQNTSNDMIGASGEVLSNIITIAFIGATLCAGFALWYFIHQFLLKNK